MVALLLLGLLSVDQVRVWRSSRTLFAHALEATEHNHVAHVNLGLALHRGRRSVRRRHERPVLVVLRSGVDPAAKECCLFFR